MAQPGGKTHSQGEDVQEKALTLIAETLSRMRFGSIALTVHDGTVIQLDITEKRRLDR